MSTPEAKVMTLAALRDQPKQEIVRAGFSDSASFDLLQRCANALSKSTLVPSTFQNNLPNCIIALEMAQRIGASPLMVAQHLYIVQGKPSWSAVFLIASFNQCGRFTPIRYEFEGKPGTDDWGCRATATDKESKEKLVGPLITIALAKKEGWYSKGGSKWQTIPELMLRYRAAAWFVRTVAPEISMGLQTAEELHDVYDAAPNADGKYSVDLESLRADETPAPVETIIDSGVPGA